MNIRLHIRIKFDCNTISNATFFRLHVSALKVLKEKSVQNEFLIIIIPLL